MNQTITEKQYLRGNKMKKTDLFSLKDVPKLGPIGIQKLEDAGIVSKTDMLVFTWTEIASVTGMTKEDSETAVQFCRDALQKSGDQWNTNMNAWELLEKRKGLKYWTTGSKAVDILIGGGIESRAVTEFSGKFRSGKTQISHSLACTIAMAPSENKHPNRVLMIDTEDTCRPERLQEIILARDKKADVKAVLENIIVQRPQDASHQIIIMENAVHLIKELNIKAIVIDSGTALFRQELSDFGQQGLKFRKLNKMVHLMKSTAEVFDIPVIVMNQVYDSSDPFSPGQKIYGGNVWGHAMTYRIALRKKGKMWVAQTYDFPHKPIEDEVFNVTAAGIVDVKEKKK